jgi:hypothetical protein
VIRVTVVEPSLPDTGPDGPDNGRVHLYGGQQIKGGSNTYDDARPGAGALREEVGACLASTLIPNATLGDP